MNLEKVLESQWFSHREAKIYLSLLQLWDASVGTVARTSWLGRTNVHDGLQKLLEKWFISFCKVWKVSYYQAKDPSLLEKQAELNLGTIKGALPQLVEISRQPQIRPKIQEYAWLYWIQNIYTETLLSTTGLLVFRGLGNLNKWLESYIDENYIPQRVQKWISVKVLTSELSDKYLRTAKEKLREVKITKNYPIDLQWDIIIFDQNKVAFVTNSWSDLHWIIHFNKNLHNTMKSLFLYFWDK